MMGFPGVQRALHCLMWKRKAAQELGLGFFIGFFGSCQFRSLSKLETSVS